MDTLLSIVTLYNYDPTIFDNMVLPTGVDKDLIVDNIMLELGELELLYNDPDFMKFAIGRWSNKELRKWTDLYNTTNLDYNPIENYNRTDTFTDTETRDLNSNNLETRDLSKSNLETRNLTGSENQTKDLAGSSLETRDLSTTVNGTSGTDDVTVTSGGDSVSKTVSGYNDLAQTESERETTTLGSTTTKDVDTTTSQTGTDTGTVNVATTDTGTDNKAMTESGTVNNAEAEGGTVNNSMTEGGTVTKSNSGNSKGNIGVTSTQQLIEQQRGVVEFCIDEYIIQSFKTRFCIMVY